MDVAQRVRGLVEPVATQDGLELYDIEFSSGILRVTVDRSGGIDVDAIGELSHRISRLLDDVDPVPDTRYLLEVSSPGIERRLRLPEHFRAQLGAVVRVKTKTVVDGSRRFDGRLEVADDEGVELAVDGRHETLRIAYNDIEHARVVFDWSTTARSKTQISSSHDKKATAR